MIAANGTTAVAQNPTTIALLTNGLKAAIAMVAMRAKVKGMQGKVDGVVNTAAGLNREGAVNIVPVAKAIARVVKVIDPVRKTIWITRMIVKADTATSCEVTILEVTTTLRAVTPRNATTIRLASARVKATVNADAALNMENADAAMDMEQAAVATTMGKSVV